MTLRGPVVGALDHTKPDAWQTAGSRPRDGAAEEESALADAERLGKEPMLRFLRRVHPPRGPAPVTSISVTTSVTSSTRRAARSAHGKVTIEQRNLISCSARPDYRIHATHFGDSTDGDRDHRSL